MLCVCVCSLAVGYRMWDPAQCPKWSLFSVPIIPGVCLSVSCLTCQLFWVLFCFCLIWWWRSVGIKCAAPLGFPLNYFCNVFIALFAVSSSRVSSMMECIHFVKIRKMNSEPFLLRMLLREADWCFVTFPSEKICFCLLPCWIIPSLPTPSTL